MGRNKLKQTKKERLEEKKEETKRAKESNAHPKKKDFDVDEAIEDVHRECDELQLAVTKFYTNAELEDLHFVYRGQNSHFAGHNSERFNLMYWGAKERLSKAHAKLELLKEKKDPGKKARRAIAEAERHHMWSVAFGSSSSVVPKYPKGVIVVERVGAGFLLSMNEHGQLYGIRCYHKNGDKYDPCDCVVDERRTMEDGYKHTFVLSTESERLKALGKLAVNETKLELQYKTYIGAAGGGSGLVPIDGIVSNIHAGLGKAVHDYRMAHPEEEEREEGGKSGEGGKGDEEE